MDIGGSKSQIRASFCSSVFSDRWRCEPIPFLYEISTLFVFTVLQPARTFRVSNHILLYWSTHFFFFINCCFER